MTVPQTFTRNEQFPSSRPIPVALVALGGMSVSKVTKLAWELNHLKGQNLFDFGQIKHKVELPTRTLPHAYKLDDLYTVVKNVVVKNGYTYGIGLTLEVLENERFNWHSENDPVGVVTENQIEKFNPVGRTDYQYLAYLVLCEALCITGRAQLEHKEINYCLFDECENKEDLTKCMTRPHIHCPESLKAVGFVEDDLKSTGAILKYIEKRRFSDVFQHTFSKWYVGIILGYFTKSAIEYSKLLSGRWNLLLNVFLLLLIAFLMVKEYRPLFRRKRKKEK